MPQHNYLNTYAINSGNLYNNLSTSCRFIRLANFEVLLSDTNKNVYSFWKVEFWLDLPISNYSQSHKCNLLESLGISLTLPKSWLVHASLEGGALSLKAHFVTPTAQLKCCHHLTSLTIARQLTNAQASVIKATQRKYSHWNTLSESKIHQVFIQYSSLKVALTYFDCRTFYSILICKFCF